MDKNEKWLQWAVELQSLAQAGLFYGKDAFDRERYERIREIAAEMVSHQSDIPLDKVKNLFCNEIGFCWCRRRTELGPCPGDGWT